ncbi:alpha-E domain-containing protein [Luteimonas viscosa]|uniref:Alpha-E domain-containing protein n=1 Tax=Luteimonas viscosa TaxID=1132694 RepID=A0A5D4XM70_9GAMM|nr:alpha-E domain-containing protein [Luteimonas viscosa]TYT25736.1 alpha-E domain-containing protein [Luteimonas viscosa]
MLCRTASDLYWVSRHMERAENTARLVDLALRIAMLPERYDRGKSEAAPWRRALDALGTGGHYTATYGTIEPEGVLRHFLLSPENPSSIQNCLRAARENARAQRGAITAEMYEDLNASWLEIRSRTWAGVRSDGISSIVEWVKSRSASFRGVTIGTLGRGEAYQFLQLGAFVERSDWAIRLLDVVGSDGEIDESGEARDAAEYFQWSALLQSQSAFETYRRLYRESVTPRSVTDLMLLRDVNPRSLQTCLNTLHEVLRAMTGGESQEVVRLAGALSAQTRYARIDDIIAHGLEPHLQATLSRLAELGEAIHAQFMVSLDAGHGQSQAQG